MSYEVSLRYFSESVNELIERMPTGFGGRFRYEEERSVAWARDPNSGLDTIWLEVGPDWMNHGTQHLIFAEEDREALALRLEELAQIVRKGKTTFPDE